MKRILRDIWYDGGPVIIYCLYALCVLLAIQQSLPINCEIRYLFSLFMFGIIMILVGLFTVLIVTNKN